MKKIILATIFGFLIFVSANSPLYAALVTIDKNGEIIWNVLSEEDSQEIDIPQHSSIEIKKAAEMTPAPSSVVTLSKTDQKISLVVSANNETKELDVSKEDVSLVEIEERANVQKLAIGIKDGKFTLKQKGVLAETEYPVNIDSKTANLSLITPSGQRFISIFPLQAVESALRTKLMSRLSGRALNLFERDRELQYSVQGEKVFDFFKMYDYPIPVTFFVSASTGEILGLDAPLWFKVIGYLLV